MIWAIPDIHGRFDLLMILWKKLEAEGIDLSRDKVIYLGDMIDRGFGVADTLKFIKRQCESSDNVLALRGNHEMFLLKCYSLSADQTDWDLWFYENNGGKTSHASLMALPAHERMEFVDWIRTLPLFHKEDGFFFSHAPIPRENRRSLLNQGQPFTEDELLWGHCDDEPGFARDFKDKIGVCGHVHKLRHGIREPRFYPHYIFADAGCGCHEKAPLVAIEVKTRKVIYATLD